MLTAITYNCDPDSLGDVTQEAFVEAFENEVRARPNLRELSVRVTFAAAVRSGVTKFASDDFEGDLNREDEFHDLFDRLAEKAFQAAVESEDAE